MSQSQADERLIRRAVQAVRDFDAAERPEQAWAAEQAGGPVMDEAARRGLLPRVALAAGLRQLRVALMVADPVLRGQALAAAYHDAERYAGQVREAQRQHARTAVAQGVPKSTVAARLNVTRPTLDAWLSSER